MARAVQGSFGEHGSVLETIFPFDAAGLMRQKQSENFDKIMK